MSEMIGLGSPMTSEARDRSSPGWMQPHGLRRWWREIRPVLVAFLVVGALFYCVAVYGYLYRVLVLLHYNDFGKFYYSMVEWRDSGVLYGPNPATLIPFGPQRAEHLWNMNPPHFHFLIWPLTFFSIERAHGLWVFLNLTALLVAVIAIARAVPVKARVVTWLGVAVFAAASAPVQTWAVTGQLTGLLVGAVTWIWLDLRRSRWTAAAIMIGLVTSIKPFLAPLGLYLLFRKQWRAVIVMAISASAAFALGLAVFGVQTHRDWLAALGDARWTGAVMNASVSAPIGRFWTADVFVEGAIPRVMGGVLAAAVLCIGVFAAWRAQDVDRRVLLLLATSLLASPLGWVYYVPTMMGPMLGLKSSRQFDRTAHITLAGFWIPHFVLFPFPSRLFAFTIGSIYAWSLLGLWITVALSDDKARQPAETDFASALPTLR